MRSSTLLLAATLMTFGANNLVGAQEVPSLDPREIHPDVVRAKRLVRQTWEFVTEYLGTPKSSKLEDMLAWRRQFFVSMNKKEPLCWEKSTYSLDGRTAYPVPVFYSTTPHEPKTLVWGVMMVWPDEEGKKGEGAVRFVWRTTYRDELPPTRTFHAEYRHLKRHWSDPTRIVQLLHPDGTWSYDKEQIFPNLNYRRRAPRWHQGLSELVRVRREDMIKVCAPQPRGEFRSEDLHPDGKQQIRLP